MNILRGLVGMLVIYDNTSYIAIQYRCVNGYAFLILRRNVWYGLSWSLWQEIASLEMSLDMDQYVGRIHQGMM